MTTVRQKRCFFFHFRRLKADIRPFFPVVTDYSLTVFIVIYANMFGIVGRRLPFICHDLSQFHIIEAENYSIQFFGSVEDSIFSYLLLLLCSLGRLVLVHEINKAYVQFQMK